MIKITSSRKKYLPTRKHLRPSNDKEPFRQVRTEYQTRTLQSEMKTLNNYFKVFEQIRGKNTPLKRTIEHITDIKKQSIQWQSQLNISQYDYYQSELQTHTTNKLSQLLKQTQQFTKRQSCNYTDRNIHRQNWMMTIMRRKNNGSYGQIIRGPTNIKHETVLEKARAITTYRQRSRSIVGEIDISQKFIPLGTISRCQSKKYRKAPSVSKNRKVLTTKTKKQKIDQIRTNLERAQNIKSKTEPDEHFFKNTYQNSKKGQLGFSNLIKKLSQPCKLQKNISPWDVSGPV